MEARSVAHFARHHTHTHLAAAVTIASKAPHSIGKQGTRLVAKAAER